MKHKKFINICLFVLSLIYLFIYLRPSLSDFDENYTLALIQHSYKSIIYLDSLDVHPPLYYFLVKSFIEITTFWTSYLPLKIFFARLFSVIISIITFIFLRKITIKLHIVHNIFIQWILLLLLPNVLGCRFSLQQFTDIRMYSLAALFITIEFYYYQFYCLYLFVCVVIQLLRGPIFQYRYMYPILLIYEFIGFNSMITLYKYNHNLIKYLLFLFGIFCIALVFSVDIQIRGDKQSINSVNTYNKWQNTPHVVHFIRKHVISQNDYDTNYISYIYDTDTMFIIPKKYKKLFKNNVHIYNNKAYRKLFNKAIKGIEYK